MQDDASENEFIKKWGERSIESPPHWFVADGALWHSPLEWMEHKAKERVKKNMKRTSNLLIGLILVGLTGGFFYGLFIHTESERAQVAAACHSHGYEFDQHSQQAGKFSNTFWFCYDGKTGQVYEPGALK